MNNQTKSNRQTIAFITAIVLLLAANFSAFAQENWAKGEEWRGQYKIGDKVKYTVSGSEADFQICTVTENAPTDLLRVKCDDFKYWKAGIYYGSTEKSFRPLQKANNQPTNDQTETAPAETPNNSAEWSVIDEWRSSFKVGDKIKMSISGKAEDLQTCVVTENEPESVMRAKCGNFKQWKAGVNIVSEFQVNVNAKTTTNPQNIRTTNQGNSTRLKIGEYACTGAGGRMMIGLGFKITSANRYTDLDGKRSGTFTISGGKITFRGGHLNGITGRDLKDNWFTVGSQAQCGHYN
ncbi:MAG: porin [Pyrinomonadaceae bacterium]|nr:porin [Pyrinomonadaceae bacterium]